MTIRKSSALHNWLLGLNFRILVWQLDIGYWIETALDWAITWTNEAWDRAEAAYYWAKAAWDHADELLPIVNSSINRVRDELLGKFDTLGSYLDDWWNARISEIQELISASFSTTLHHLASFSTTLHHLATQWDTFRHSTLPSLIDLTWFRSWWGRGGTAFNDWWSAARGELREETEVTLAPVRDQVNKHTSILDTIKKLFTDPEEFILEILGRIW